MLLNIPMITTTAGQPLITLKDCDEFVKDLKKLSLVPEMLDFEEMIPFSREASVHPAYTDTADNVAGPSWKTLDYYRDYASKYTDVFNF